MKKRTLLHYSIFGLFAFFLLTPFCVNAAEETTNTSTAQETTSTDSTEATTSSETTTQTITFKKVAYTRYAKKKIKLYKSPKASAVTTKTIKKSTAIKVTGKSKNGWSRIKYAKKTYYVKTSQLAKTNGYTVVIDAGHQKKANTALEPIGPGASTKKMKVTGGATGTATGQAEYKLNLKVAKLLQKELKSRGYKVIMVRTSHNVNMSNSERAKIANKANADVFIRIHANADSSSSANGALTISPTKDNPYCKSIYKKSKQLSEAVLKEFCKSTGVKNRGVMYTDSMSGINWCKVPVTIIEMGFLSNASEDKKMATSSYQKKMATGMANGIDSYLNR